MSIVGIEYWHRCAPLLLTDTHLAVYSRDHKYTYSRSASLRGHRVYVSVPMDVHLSGQYRLHYRAHSGLLSAILLVGRISSSLLHLHRLLKIGACETQTRHIVYYHASSQEACHRTPRKQDNHSTPSGCLHSSPPNTLVQQPSWMPGRPVELH